MLAEKLPCSRFRAEMILCFEGFGVEDTEYISASHYPVERDDTEGSSITPWKLSVSVKEYGGSFNRNGHAGVWLRSCDSESFRIRMYCSEHDDEKVSGEDHPTAGRSAASYRYSSKTPVFGQWD